MSSYRERFIAQNPGIIIPGRQGNWYRCVKCGGLCGRGNGIPDAMKMEVDHRIPKRDGGTDDIWNLQPTCRKCNRSKSDNQTELENVETMVRAVASDGFAGLGTVLISGASRKFKDSLGIKYKR